MRLTSIRVVAFLLAMILEVSACPAQGYTREAIDRAHEARVVVFKSFDRMHDKFGYTLHTLIVPAEALKSQSFDVPVSRIRYRTAALFEYNKADLTADAAKITTDLAQAIRADQSIAQIAVVGHT